MVSETHPRYYNTRMRNYASVLPIETHEHFEPFSNCQMCGSINLDNVSMSDRISDKQHHERFNSCANEYICVDCGTGTSFAQTVMDFDSFMSFWPVQSQKKILAVGVEEWIRLRKKKGLLYRI